MISKEEAREAQRPDSPPSLAIRRFLKAVELVRTERQRQDEKWGWPQNNSPEIWMTVLGEEYGELCQEVLRVTFNGKSTDDMVAEAVQVAAVCFAMLEEWYEQGLISDESIS